MKYAFMLGVFVILLLAGLARAADAPDSMLSQAVELNRSDQEKLIRAVAIAKAQEMTTRFLIEHRQSKYELEAIQDLDVRTEQIHDVLFHLNPEYEHMVARREFALGAIYDALPPAETAEAFEKELKDYAKDLSEAVTELSFLYAKSRGLDSLPSDQANEAIKEIEKAEDRIIEVIDNVMLFSVRYSLHNTLGKDYLSRQKKKIQRLVNAVTFGVPAALQLLIPGHEWYLTVLEITGLASASARVGNAVYNRRVNNVLVPKIEENSVKRLNLFFKAMEGENFAVPTTLAGQGPYARVEQLLNFWIWKKSMPKCQKLLTTSDGE
ncbi:MAG: hypothetical protein AB1540_05120 [Bdellovibrionota bacterium]